ISALAAVAGVSEEELEPRLASLVRRELLQREMDARSPETGHYGFVQALIREVAYNTLAKKDRKRLHLAAARYFESLENEEIAGALASHYLAAYASAGETEEADALATQARIALKAAAARATALGGFSQAANFFEQALTVTTDESEQAQLLEQAGTAAQTAGRVADAEALIRRSLDLRIKLGDRNGEAGLIGLLGWMLSSSFRADEASDLIEPALDRLADVDDQAALAWLKSYAASVRVRRNENESALPLIEEALDTAEHLGLMELLARSLLTKSSVLNSLGRLREALSLALATRDISAEFGYTEMQLRGYNNLASMYADLDVRRSLELNMEAIALARRSGLRSALLQLTSNAGYTGFMAGEWDAVLPPMEAVLQEDLSPRDHLQVLNNAIIIRAALGQDVAAQMADLENTASEMSGTLVQSFIDDPAANQALALGDDARASDLFGAMYSTSLAAAPEYTYRASLAAIWAGDVAQAETHRREFEKTGGTGSMRDARSAVLEAGISALEGQTVQSANLFRDSLRNWRAVGAVWDEALAGITMAQLLNPRDPEVADVIASTREILTRLRAKPYLERLERAASREIEAPTQAKKPARRAEVAVGD
ncbi:MAG TPA: hypothetical protein VH371_11645, partial [Candidatus Limnocylindrales bacterium]